MTPKKSRSNPIAQSFFARPAPDVAPDLLGKVLVRRVEGQVIAAVITETEAYEGCDDLACHASKGRTGRTEVMFGEPGHFYVYLIYGMHYMLNIVTNQRDCASAVLIRSLDVISGPGRLTRALQIDKSLNTLAAMPETGLWLEDRGLAIPREKILLTPRIGVDYAGPVWAAKPWRFTIDNASLAATR